MSWNFVQLNLQIEDIALVKKLMDTT